ncbi:MAG: glycerate kinase [Propionibacteriaceae bacterium]|nr:glycerate kinase [Propionibacteriaceae bacterium]
MKQPEVVIAPDSFKGSLTATEAARAIGAGWARIRPADRLRLLPQADGGEGTLAALAAADSAARWQAAGIVVGPDGRDLPGRWLRLGAGPAAAELALVSGLPLMRSPAPLTAGTHGLGAVLRAIAGARVRNTLVGLGGSASTDGGAGLLTALGARLRDASGRELPAGGAALTRLARLDLTGLVRPPGLVVLSDVTAPLLGPSGAAAVFGPQKGAGPEEIEILERGLTRWAEVVGVDPQQPGAGAAGGTAYALTAVLGARLEPGAPFIARATGLVAAARDADVLITGEGKVDATTATGKTVGHALSLTGPGVRIVIAGEIETAPAQSRAYSLSELAGGREPALADPERWLAAAGAAAARDVDA